MRSDLVDLTIDIALTFPQLCSLIRFTHKLHSMCLIAIDEVSEMNVITILAAFLKLRELSIGCGTALSPCSEEELEAIARIPLTALVEVTLNFSPPIRDEFLVKFVSRCPSLENCNIGQIESRWMTPWLGH